MEKLLKQIFKKIAKKEVKYLGIINNFKEKTKEKAKNKVKRKLIVNAVVHAIGPFLLIGTVALVAVSVLDWVVEIFTAKNNPKLMYETLEIEDVAELITIKGDETSGYYLDFTDGIDEKLEKIISKYNKSAEYHNLPRDVNFLKNMLKAEAFTQFPDLKGTIPSDSEDGFQGAITIRRVTPNKSPRRNEKYW